MKRFLGVLVMGFVVFMPAGVLAQTAGKNPVEISADKTLEWHKGQRQYIARGNAVVKQGALRIAADTITADYHEGPKGKKAAGGGLGGVAIYRMTGVGHVQIAENGTTATGDKVVYDLDTGLATLTGTAPKMISPDQTVTAQHFEYGIKTGRLKAIGGAVAVRGDDTLRASEIDAVLGPEKDGKRALDRLEATGNVTITTPNEILAGDRGTFDSTGDHAVIVGHVKITRGANILTGARAELDLKTNVSRLFGSSVEDGQTGGRVQGVFYPGDIQKAPEKQREKEKGKQ